MFVCEMNRHYCTNREMESSIAAYVTAVADARAVAGH